MKTISFKVREDEARKIRRLAAQEGLSLSEFLRRRAGVGAEAAPIRLTRCSETGARIFAARPEGPELTTEKVKKMLEEFP